jgi:hypothetical protein
VKGEEGNPQWQVYSFENYGSVIKRSKQVVQVLDYPTGIFEKGKQAEIDCYRQGQEQLSFGSGFTVLDQDRQHIVGCYRRKHDPDETNLAPGIKEQTGKEKIEVACERRPEQEVSCQNNR